MYKQYFNVGHDHILEQRPQFVVHEVSCHFQVLTACIKQVVEKLGKTMRCSRKHFGRGKVVSTKYCVCVCVLCSTQSACAVLYCHLWPLLLYSIRLHYLTNGAIFRKKFLNIKCEFSFCLHFYLKYFILF